MAQVERPLSPHIQVYKPQLTSVLSILHRVTGVALGAGALLLAWWLLAAAHGPGQFETVRAFMASWLGRLLLFGFTFSLFYHLCNGTESFWSMLKRGYIGVCHKMSPKRRDRYVMEFQGRHNDREPDTISQMGGTVVGMGGKRPRYKDLIKPNGLPSGVRR